MLSEGLHIGSWNLSSTLLQKVWMPFHGKSLRAWSKWCSLPDNNPLQALGAPNNRFAIRVLASRFTPKGPRDYLFTQQTQKPSLCAWRGFVPFASGLGTLPDVDSVMEKLSTPVRTTQYPAGGFRS